MALTLLAANNAQTVLAAGISSSATSMTVNTGTGSLFPSPSAGTSFFKLTFVDAATGQLTEIVHVTARSGDTMTIERGQEGTVARAWSANDIAANMMTAGTLSYLLTNFQPLDATLTAIASLTGAANKLAYFNGPDTAALTDLTAVGRDIIGKATASDVVSYLGVGTGRLLNIQVFTASASYTPTTGTSSILVYAVGGGGGGGGTQNATATTASAGRGGDSGSWGIGRYTSGFTGLFATVGTPGTAGTGGSSPTAGGNGGSTALGTLINVSGGAGGSAGLAVTPPAVAQSQVPTTGSTTGANIFGSVGSQGQSGIHFATTASAGWSGAGGSCPTGAGGSSISIQGNGEAGHGYGSGGSGGRSAVSGTGQNGGAGASGIIIIAEYA